MQNWPALVGKRGVNAVVDKVAVAVGNKDAEDECVTGAGDSLELEDAAGRMNKQVFVLIERLQNPATVREDR